MRHDSIGYWWLVERYRRMGYDAHAIAERYDEHVEDVLVNVFYALVTASAGPARRRARSATCAARADQTEAALLERCYDERHRPVLRPRGPRRAPGAGSRTWSSLAPLALTGCPRTSAAGSSRSTCCDPRRYRVATGIPSVARSGAHVQPALRPLALLARARVDEHSLAARAPDDRARVRGRGRADRALAGGGGRCATASASTTTRSPGAGSPPAGSGLPHCSSIFSQNAGSTAASRPAVPA